MNQHQKYLVLDYETRSEANLKKTGSYEYARHHSTRILCASWRYGTRAELQTQIEAKQIFEKRYPDKKNPFAAKVWSPAFNDLDHVTGLLAPLINPNTKVIAHNALFEQAITRFVLGRYHWAHPRIKDMDHDRWICTAAGAASLALPRNLEGACQALKLAVQKDMIGRRLILKYCKPRKPTKNNPAKWHTSARDLRRIIQYCQTDVDAETLLFLTLPPLNETERKVWLLDQKINFTGFLADRELVKTSLKLIGEETQNLNEETKEITSGLLSSATQRDRVLKWLQREGVFLPDLRAKTVDDAIREGLVDGRTKRILEIRQAISKTSTAKYSAFEIRSRSDGRVRDILMYHAASTGRWGGTGVQPQNFPRGNIADTTLAADILREGDLESVRFFFGAPMDVLSSCLRSVIIAPKGRRLLCADYAAIEARVLFWVAKHAAGLKAYEEDRPMYEEMAAIIYNIDHIEEVTKLQRQVGKQSVLGCGYGMGAKKFLATCKNFGIEVDEEIARAAVNAYRSTHYPVPRLWGNLERAALAAVRKKGTKFKINFTTWWVECLEGTDLEFLWCELPSKRRLAYFGPEIKWDLTSWGEKKATLYHWGANPLSKKWELANTYGGKLTENVVQAISRDLMADAMLRIDSTGYEPVLTVHDEILAEMDEGRGSIKEFEALMAETPSWAAGLPVKVEGWEGPRYKK